MSSSEVSQKFEQSLYTEFGVPSLWLYPFLDFPTSLYSCFGSPKFSYLVPQAGKISSLFPNYSYLEHPTEVYC